MKVNQHIKRDSSIELLRIFAMIMIVFHHFAVHGGFAWEASDVTIPHLWYNFIVMGGKIGVDLFVLISGYFLTNRESPMFDFQKIIKFWGQVFFYSIAIYIVFGLCGISDLGGKSIMMAISPITAATWWFVSDYFVLYLLHPFINKGLCCLNKRNYQTLIILLVTLWSIIPTFTNKPFRGNNLLWFITLYVIAGYVRKYKLNSKIKTKHYFCLWIVFSILTYLSSVVFMIMGRRWEIFDVFMLYFYGQEKLTILLISLSLFMIFERMNMCYHKWINVIASATFGVYLIHDHFVVRDFLWSDLFQNAQYQSTILLIPYSIIVVVFVYTVCTIIDLIRQKVFEKPFMLIVYGLSLMIIKPLEKIIDVFRFVVFGEE